MNLQHIEETILKTPFDRFNFVKTEELMTHRTLTAEALKKMIQRCKEGGRDFSEAEEKVYESCDKYLDALNEELDVRVEKRPLPNVYIAGRKIGENIIMEKTFLERKNLSYRDLFHEGRSEVIFERGGYNSFNDFLNVVTKKLETRALNETMGTDGGFSVPEYWAAEIWDSALEGSVFMDGVSMYPMKSNILYIPAWRSDDHTAGPVGGVMGQWLGELQTADRVTPKMRFVKLEAQKLAIFVQGSIEIEEDSLTLSQQIAPTLRRSLNFTLDDVLISGNGIAKPQGITSAAGIIQHTRVTANQIGFADVCGMYARLHPSLVIGARWLASPSTLPQLLTIATTAGEALFIPKGGLSEKVPGYVLGLPLYITEKVSSLGTTGDLILTNPVCYALGLRKEMTFERSIAPGWTEYAADYRLVCRVDGKPLMSNAITPKGGGNTLSWAVLLK
jgi:HK97 family phage major capsid protein